MARPPKLRKHKGYWYTQAGSAGGVYFGRIDQVPYHDAEQQFRDYLADLHRAPTPAALLPSSRVSVAELCDWHLKWVRTERSAALLKQRKSILNSWCNHTLGAWNGQQLAGHGQLVGRLAAEVITRSHVEQYLHHRCTNPSDSTGKPLGDKARRAHVIALKATWNWGADTAEDGGASLLPAGHRPLAKLSRGFIQAKDLSEADLPTDEEIAILLKWSAVEPSQIRAGTGSWRPRTAAEQATPDSRVFADLIRCYHSTGARTSELCLVRVRDFMPRTRQLILGKHKRSRTQANPTVRTIQVDVELADVLRCNCRGKQSDAPLFTYGGGKAWNQELVNARLRSVKLQAAAAGHVVRDHITPYSFRDLYISELLMLGDPPFKVAKFSSSQYGESA